MLPQPRALQIYVARNILSSILICFPLDFPCFVARAAQRNIEINMKDNKLICYIFLFDNRFKKVELGGLLGVIRDLRAPWQIISAPEM